MYVFGTRPEAIKMAPLINYMKIKSKVSVKVCVTGQHREMLDQVLDLFQIHPDYDLSVMEAGQNLANLSAKILNRLGNVLSQENPDVVAVHGDTTTSFMTALACYYNQIPVAHIEAGLRSGNLHSPWPEEGNRKLTGQLCKYHFAPTEENKSNLLSEGVNSKSIFVTGNTVIDALLSTLEKVRDPNFFNKLDEDVDINIIDKYERLILITGHRRENFGNNFEEICKSIVKLAHMYPNILFFYPVHLNPNVNEPVKRILSNLKNVRLAKPLDYAKFIYVMDKAYLILSDSGGIQEEAPSLGKPVLVMRENTERPEGLNAGSSILVGYDQVKIISQVSKLLEDQTHYDQIAKTSNPYGDGSASKIITNILVKELKVEKL
jgi:UDP-N-acetylglucosamine 2-epimerase (non-hydrolysing)